MYKGREIVAEKRMFSKKITNSDVFLDMPMSAQALYFHLNLSADDEGFIDSPRMVMRMIHSSEDDMRLLIAKNFVINFDETGIIVVKDWRIHNTIRKDRIKETIHTAEFKRLSILENGSYEKSANVPQPSVNQMSTKCQHRLVESSIDKTSIDKSSVVKNKEIMDTTQPSFTEFNIFSFVEQNFNRVLSPVEMETLKFWLEDYDPELIKEATRIAITNNAFSLRYIETILTNWEKQKLTTVAMVREHEKKRMGSAKNRYSNNQKKETLPDWVDTPVVETPVSEETAEFFKEELKKLRERTPGNEKTDVEGATDFFNGPT